MIFFVDLETTGLDPNKDSILELALVACDDDLKEVSRHTSLVRPVSSLADLSPYVHKMHTDSGLLVDLQTADEAATLPRRYEAELAAVKWFNEVLPPDVGNKKPPMGGSSVHFDRAFLKVHMPDLERCFGYRNVDASSFYEGALRWAPALTREGIEPKIDGNPHRALPDILFSIERLRVYRRELFLGWQHARTPQDIARGSEK